jgi:hypothetical protein
MINVLSVLAGIQQYLYENGRLDNIFTDTYYDTFTDSLNDVLQRYEIRLNTQGTIACLLTSIIQTCHIHIQVIVLIKLTVNIDRC